MKKNGFVLLILGLVVLATGCATVPKVTVPAQRTSAVISASKDKVWPLLVQEISLNYSIQVIEKDSGLITTPFTQISVGYNNNRMGRYVFPPGGFFATWGGLRMNMRVIVTESEKDKTLVKIVAHYEAYESNISKSWRVVRSNGAVENQILTSVERALE